MIPVLRDVTPCRTIRAPLVLVAKDYITVEHEGDTILRNVANRGEEATRTSVLLSSAAFVLVPKDCRNQRL